jgi:exopolysaccharide production protein ExoZ
MVNRSRLSASATSLFVGRRGVPSAGGSPASDAAVVTRKLNSLQALRAVAAVLVVMFHTQVTLIAKSGVVPFYGIFSDANRGVDLFFVLSGFIVTYTHAADWGKPARVWNYLFNRLSRIYPSVWIVTGLTVGLVGAGLGGAFTARELSPWSIVTTALLIPDPNAIIGVIWSLKAEIFFYFAFMLIIIRPAVGWIFLVLWQGAVLTLALFGAAQHHVSYAFAFYCQPRSLEFCVGMACALFYARTRKSQSIPPPVLWATLLVGIISFSIALTVMKHLMGLYGALILGASSGLIITSLVLLESAGQVCIPNWLIKLGDSSYCVYLVHYSVIAVVSRLPFAPAILNGWLANDLLCLALAATGVSAGVAFDHVCDRPLQRLLRRTKRAWLSSVDRIPSFQLKEAVEIK